MRPSTWTSVVASLMLLAGCAAQTPWSTVAPAGDAPSALAVAPPLSGAWRGAYGQVGASLYADEASCTLRIDEGGTFTATCVRSQIGTNNLAKASSWSGRVVTNGSRVVLQTTDGRWPSIVLKRSADGALYGVTVDPLVEATIMLKFERAGG
jgi:uncharacterized lipoprotein YajG